MVDDRKIPEGYKVTEAGVIPDDWDSLNVKDLVSFSGGSQPPKSTFRREKRPGYIRLIQIRDYKNDDYLTFIPEMLANKKCSADDIMIGRYGPPIFQILRGINGAYNVALMKALPNEKLEKEYLYYFLKQESLFRFIELLSRRSSGQTGVDLVALREYPFPLPPLQEQKAIAEVLSDTDSLIQSIEKLIDKKKKIKQGAMQQLLTGKKRLPGFSGEWEIKKLGDIVSINKGQLITEKDAQDGTIPVIAGGKKPAYYHSFPNRQGKTITISASGANAGYVGFYTEPIFASDCSTIGENNGYSIEFIYYQLSMLQENIYYAQTGGAQPHIHPKDLKPLLINYTNFKEQKAIAQVLSDMDAEIEGLEEKLEKYKTIKQGMMQELLTGRIRLI